VRGCIALRNERKICFFFTFPSFFRNFARELDIDDMVRNIFKGLGIALITPFQQNGEVDYDAIIRLVDYQLDNGADFFCILATTGETPTLSSEEKQKIKDLIVDRVRGRVPILMGCGGNNTAAVVRELQEGDFRGIDGVLSVCPYYNKPSQEGLYQHFKAIAAATQLPVVLYNVPGRTGVNMQAATTVRLARDCKNIVAIKEASGNLEQVDEIIKNKPKDFDVISGDDSLTFPMVSCGAVGVISVIGNALPKEFSKMIRLQMRGEYDPARKIHHRFTDLFSLLFVDGNPAGVKAMLHEMGFIENVLRLPLVPTRISTLQRMSEIMKELKI
jgi:4-hydroxy-tetrahydrodipicolinate synthase